MSELGLVLLLLAGFAQGSFGLGMKKQSPLSWESFWLIYSLFAMLVVPFVWGYAGFDSFMESILMTDSKSNYDITAFRLFVGYWWNFIWNECLLCWNIYNQWGSNGIGRRSWSHNSFVWHRRATHQPSFIYVILGVAIMLVGVALSAYSGILREKEQNVGSSKVNNSQKSSLVKGLVIVVSSGILSSLLNVGFEAAIPIIDNAKSLGATYSASSIPARAVVVFGGLLMNAGYAIFLLCKNKTWGDFSFKQQGSITASVWAVITGFLWFLPLGLSGIVSVSIGELGNVITWPVMLSLSLIFGNIWGYLTGEWKNTKHSFLLMIVASVILIAACMILTFKDSFIN